MRNFNIGDLDLGELAPVAGDILEVGEFNSRGEIIDSKTTSFIYNGEGFREYTQVSEKISQFSRAGNEGELTTSNTLTYRLVYQGSPGQAGGLAALENYDWEFDNIQRKTVEDTDRRPPDIGPDPVAFNERYDRSIRNAETARGHDDRGTLIGGRQMFKHALETFHNRVWSSSSGD